MYFYSALVTDVHDGDTVTVDIDLGLFITLRQEKIRLFGINAPEVTGASKPEGLKSRDALRQRVLNQQISLQTIKDRKEKYGRWLGIVNLNGESINQWMLDNGYAVVDLLT